MPARKKSKPKEKQATGATGADSNASPQDDHEEVPGAESATNGPPKPPKGSLKEFVEQFKDRHYYVIEMRIVLVCCLGIFLKLFFSDTLSQSEDEMLTYSALLFIILCVLVIVFSTWLDYFPSRLVETQTRESKGQGLSMSCLVLPMTCCAQLYFSLHYAQHLTGLLQLYLVVLCVLSMCSILGTLLHSIPHPNHMVFYNFIVIATAYLLDIMIGASIWVVLPAAIVFTMLGLWLLNTFPKTFTLGEALIVTQGITLLIVDSGVQILPLYGLVSLPKSLEVARSESVLYVEFLLLGVVICCLLLSPALYKLSEAKQYYERKFWSSTFILMSLSIGFMLVLPCLGQLLGGHNPIVYLMFYSLSNPIRCALIVFWLVTCIVTGLLVWAQSSTLSWAAPLKATPPSLLVRKSFHFTALLVYLSGTALDPEFTAMASSLIMFFFIVAELGRVCRMWPFGESLHQLFLPFLGECDVGPALVTHLYLFLGFSLPLWLCPIRSYNTVVKFTMYCGSLSVGVGDAMAAIVGSYHGKVKWPGTKKTVEGSLASVFAQLVAVLLIAIIDPQLPSLSARDWGIISGSIVITTALEAYTWQIDNLILPMVQYAVTVTFLS